MDKWVIRLIILAGILTLATGVIRYTQGLPLLP